MHNDLYIDIETHPDLTPGAESRILDALEPPGSMSKADTIAKWREEKAPAIARDKWLSSALDPVAGGIYVIGWSVAGGPVRTVARDPRTDADERAWLSHALESIAEPFRAPGAPMIPRFIGWNHIGFDLPYIAKRCVCLDIAPPIPLPLASRYNGERVLDLMQAWGGGPREYVKQSAVAQALGLPDVGIDGADLWNAVCKDGVQVAERKCAADVAQLAAIHRRMSAVYGLNASAA